MFRRLTCSILASAALFGVRADTLELRDQASVTGKILVNRKDQVVVDLGFTVLVVPRAQIIRILRGESDKRCILAPPSVAGSRDSLYFAAATPPPEKNVRELVAQLGESVVQVKTPGGLGSGFFLNEDGYLLTNFHDRRRRRRSRSRFTTRRKAAARAEDLPQGQGDRPEQIRRPRPVEDRGCGRAKSSPARC